LKQRSQAIFIKEAERLIRSRSSRSRSKKIDSLRNKNDVENLTYEQRSQVLEGNLEATFASFGYIDKGHELVESVRAQMRNVDKRLRERGRRGERRK
jgi:hypothetical protein